MNLLHPSTEARNLEFDALATTAEICVGFGITNRSDVSRIHEAVRRVIERLGRQTDLERVLAALDLGDAD